MSRPTNDRWNAYADGLKIASSPGWGDLFRLLRLHPKWAFPKDRYSRFIVFEHEGDDASPAKDAA